MTYRIDPKTRRLIISDLTPSHKNQSTRVHGVGDGHVIGSKEFDDYKRQQEEEDALRDLMSEYNAIIANESHNSNRMGYEQR